MTDPEPALAALQMAIQTEIDGFNFYQRFAEQTEDPDAQAMFERLAQDEVMHLELLRNTRTELKDSCQWADYKGLPLDLVKGSPIFSRERVEQNIVAYTSDLSALRMAYLIERDFAEFYEMAAGKSEGEAQKVLAMLAHWERGHERLFKHLHDRAFEEYAQMPWGG